MTLSTSLGTATAKGADYVKRMLDIVGERDPLVLLSQFGESLRTAVSGMAANRVNVPEGPKMWSVLDVLRHCADTEIVSSYRARMILAHDTPVIEGLDQDLWLSHIQYGDATVDDYVELISVLRRMNMKVYSNLDSKALHRFGIHSERGPESMGRMLKMMAGHDEVHIKQIARIRKAVGS